MHKNNKMKSNRLIFLGALLVGIFLGYSKIQTSLPPVENKRYSFFENSTGSESNIFNGILINGQPVDLVSNSSKYTLSPSSFLDEFGQSVDSGKIVVDSQGNLSIRDLKAGMYRATYELCLQNVTNIDTDCVSVVVDIQINDITPPQAPKVKALVLNTDYVYITPIDKSDSYKYEIEYLINGDETNKLTTIVERQPDGKFRDDIGREIQEDADGTIKVEITGSGEKFTIRDVARVFAIDKSGNRSVPVERKVSNNPPTIDTDAVSVAAWKDATQTNAQKTDAIVSALQRYVSDVEDKSLGKTTNIEIVDNGKLNNINLSVVTSPDSPYEVDVKVTDSEGNQTIKTIKVLVKDFKAKTVPMNTAGRYVRVQANEIDLSRIEVEIPSLVNKNSSKRPLDWSYNTVKVIVTKDGNVWKTDSGVDVLYSNGEFKIPIDRNVNLEKYLSDTDEGSFRPIKVTINDNYGLSDVGYVTISNNTPDLFIKKEDALKSIPGFKEQQGSNYVIEKGSYTGEDTAEEVENYLLNFVDRTEDTEDDSDGGYYIPEKKTVVTTNKGEIAGCTSDVCFSSKKVGIYKITITATDSDGAIAEKSFNLEVKDEIKPKSPSIKSINTAEHILEVTLQDDNDTEKIDLFIEGKRNTGRQIVLELNEGKWYIQGDTRELEVNGKVIKVRIPREIDLIKGGKIKATSKDASGNASQEPFTTQITNQAPVINVSDKTIERGTVFTQDDIKALVSGVSDTEDDLWRDVTNPFKEHSKKLGDVSIVSTDGKTFDYNTVGEYKFKASVTDSDQETTTKDFVVKVVDTKKPSTPEIENIRTCDREVVVKPPYDDDLNYLIVSILGKDNKQVEIKINKKGGFTREDGGAVREESGKVIIEIPQEIDPEWGENRLKVVAFDHNSNKSQEAEADVINDYPDFDVPTEAVYVDISEDVSDSRLKEYATNPRDYEDDKYAGDKKELGSVKLKDKGGFENGKIGESTITLSITDSDGAETEKKFKIIVTSSKLTFIKTAEIKENKTYSVGDKIKYTFKAKNEGFLDIKLKRFVDEKMALDEPLDTLIHSDKEYVFEREYTLVQQDIELGRLENKATIYGVDKVGKNIDRVSDNGTDLDEDGDGENDNDVTISEINPIKAFDDMVLAVNGKKGKNNIINVLENDMVKGRKSGITTGDLKDNKVVTLEVKKDGAEFTQSNVTIDENTGGVSVAAGTQMGIYNIKYQICQEPDGKCSQANVTVNVIEGSVLFLKTAKLQTPNGQTVKEGDQIEYTFSMKNIGDEQVEIESLDDQKIGLHLTSADFAKIQPGDTLEKVVRYSLTAQDVEKAVVTNWATINIRESDGAILKVASDNNTPDDQGTPEDGKETIPDGIILNDPTIVRFNKIDAFDDFVGPFNSVYGTQESGMEKAPLFVLTNDRINGEVNGMNGQAPSISDVTLRVDEVRRDVDLDQSGNITIDQDGYVIVKPNTPIGKYTIDYTICHKTSPKSCSSAKVMFEIHKIEAKDDIKVFDMKNSGEASVIANDIFDGVSPINPKLVEVEFGDILDENGAKVTKGITTKGEKIVVEKGTAVGTYKTSYRVTQKVAYEYVGADSRVVSGEKKYTSEVANVLIEVISVEAGDDTVTEIVKSDRDDYIPDFNIFDNDFVNGQKVDISKISGVPQIIEPDGNIIITSDGRVKVREGLKSGTYQYTYQICFKDYPGLCDQASITFTVIDSCKIEVFNGVTVNGDAINDFLVIKGIECYTKNKVRIFNRWGQQVFEKQNYQNNAQEAFVGYANAGVINKNEALPQGTYFVIIEYDRDGEIKEKSAWFYLANFK